MIIGIDPGLSGAIAILTNKQLIIHDMPVYEITQGKSKKRQIDIHKLQMLFSVFEGARAYVEDVNSHNMGRQSAFNFGKTIGIIEALLAANKVPYTKVTPALWKRCTKTPKDKDGARQRASQLLPDYAEQWPLKKHDGRAEAALIALWGRDWA